MIAGNRAARKAFAVGLFLMFLHEFCGCFTMINYTATIFAQSGSSIPPKLSAIIVAAIQLVGTLVSTQLVDRAGRKVIIISALNFNFNVCDNFLFNKICIYVYSSCSYCHPSDPALVF